MKYIFAVLILISCISAVFCGKGDALTEAILNEPVHAVELCIYLCGGMCFWSGLMRIAERSGLTDRIARLFSHLLGGLFPALDKNGRAFHAICMNVTANLLGLGNAATPLGIEAMKAIAEEEQAGDEATPSMIIFTVLNTASITLIPSTAMSICLKYGSSNAADIIPAVWLTSAAALTVSLIAAKLTLKGRKQ
ncbi:MAG: nucleoside recognition domain-containing protein [Huintestinicola sp.]